MVKSESTQASTSTLGIPREENALELSGAQDTDDDVKVDERGQHGRDEAASEGAIEKEVKHISTQDEVGKNDMASDEAEKMMLKVNWTPLDFVIANEMLSKLFNKLKIVSFRKVNVTYGKTERKTIRMASEPNNLRMEGGLVHQAMHSVGLDVNNLRVTYSGNSVSGNVSAEAMWGAMLLGERYKAELQKSDPRIILPISHLDQDCKTVPPEAEGAPYVPLAMRWDACKLLAEALIKIEDRQVFLGDQAGAWQHMQGVAYLPAGNYEVPPGSKERKFRIYVEAPKEWTPAASSKPRPNLELLMGLAKSMYPSWAPGIVGGIKVVSADDHPLELLKYPKDAQWRMAWLSRRQWPKDPSSVSLDSMEQIMMAPIMWTSVIR